jgi:hypothetical protein
VPLLLRILFNHTNGSFKDSKHAFREKFSKDNVPTKSTVHIIVHQFGIRIYPKKDSKSAVALQFENMKVSNKK